MRSFYMLSFCLCFLFDHGPCLSLSLSLSLLLSLVVLLAQIKSKLLIFDMKQGCFYSLKDASANGIRVSGSRW